MYLRGIKSYFAFSAEQRTGIVILFTIIIILQSVYFFVDFNTTQSVSPNKKKWLAMQSKIDSLKELNPKYIVKIYPFNPNFITDYKGYKLGMSVLEIDRLLDYRKENKYVNSAKEFQSVTQISDSLLNAIAPYFKFPDWVKNKMNNKGYVKYENKAFAKKEKVALIDINLATQEDLIKIYGIGEVISLRILKLKESLGGFVSMEQMNDVWGLSPEVVESLNSHFKVYALPLLHKIDINNASLKEISQFSYFRYALAKEIVTYRSMNGDIKNVEDLIKIKGFPVEKANIIALYLDFN
ncbi:DNA uptake protein ComE [Flavobacterium gillisiae]|uniref:DNA uptake protein ComE n=1 Tax=Flavobacterium gillisiae TaxID=150146 RepID=A0A1H3XHW6_9FLAO|nr:helix-hairpin-helix domain-containing protein [Flavobacterium gillisiae]SDZ98997.1 DNA uptake protein ComE [Flavobacterium gillisiae]